MELNGRRRNIISGMAALVIVSGLIIIGVSSAFGAFDDGYNVTADFDRAGQGLIKGADVKIRGVNIGHVEGVSLVEGRARVTMFINASERIPTAASAIIRPKTLFGEKFVDVDPGDTESAGPFVATDGTAAITDTTGGFELEQVLNDLYPILRAIDPAELGSVVANLADAGEGLGPAINRQLVNGAEVLDVFARHDADTKQFLTDLATLGEELARRSDDLVAGAEALNAALPTLNSRGDQLDELLRQTGRLADDMADLIAANQDVIDKANTLGQQTIDILFDQRGDVIPLLAGVRGYLQALVEVGHIPVGDGTYMAAVKGLLAGDICSVFPCPGVAAAAPAAAPAAPAVGDQPVIAVPGTDVLGVLDDPLQQVTGGVDALLDYLAGLGRR